MNLLDAFEHTCQSRDSWRDGKGAVTARINGRHAIRVLGPDFDCSQAKPSTLIRLQRTLSEEISPQTGKKRSAAGVNRILSAFRTILQEVHYMDALDFVPSSPRLKEAEPRSEYYTQYQIDDLIEKAISVGDYDMADSIKFAFYLGCREGELLRVTVGDVDWETNQITFTDTKNGTDHTLSIPDQLELMLLARTQDCKEDVLLFDFPSRDVFYDRFCAIRDLCGFSKSYKFHTIRHSTGTLLASRGVPLRTVMGILNHRTVTTTLRYAKASDDSVKDALALL